MKGWLCALALVFALRAEPAQAPGPAPAPVPVFSTSLELVRLDVSVTREGAPVPGLAASDFEVHDEGVRQAVELVAQDEATIHAVLALDTSSSVAGEKLARLKAAAHAFADALQPDDSLSLLTFSEWIDLAVVQSQDRAEAHAAIERATTRRTTSLHDAALAALTVADPANGRPLVLLFSDGQDVGSWAAPEKLLALARESEAVVHAVVPSATDTPGILQGLTAETGGRIWEAEAGETLAEVFLRALAEFRGRYRLQYEPSGVAREGWHQLRVRVKRTDGRVYARRGYRHRGGG